MIDVDHKYELRCFCKHRSLLALYGVDRQGRMFVHMKVYKSDRVFHESVVYGGEIRILCRDCKRWHRILFIGTVGKLEITRKPEEARVSADFRNTTLANVPTR